MWLQLQGNDVSEIWTAKTSVRQSAEITANGNFQMIIAAARS